MTEDQKVQLPGDLQETVLLPLARHKFSTWIHFNNKEMLPQLEADAKRALQRLQNLSPQREHAQRLSPGGY
ncbi:MAG: hypothetical protein ACOY3I_01380 [Verrucomicrobiota bacterium]